MTKARARLGRIRPSDMHAPVVRGDDLAWLVASLRAALDALEMLSKDSGYWAADGATALGALARIEASATESGA